jgi:L-ascorbate metabolism protein UlaG (beta-lactamase superfamily)
MANGRSISGNVSRVREIEKRILNTPKKLVKVERTLLEFPLRRYFMGHAKTEKPPYKPNWRQWRDDEMTMAWLGHSMVLINFFGSWILTDPTFSERVGINLGVCTVGPRRLVGCPLDPKDLPRLDLLLVSHAHMDHSDIPSLKKLRGVRHTVVAMHTHDVYKTVRLTDLRELDWGDEIRYRDQGGLRVEAIEVNHAGWRMPWEPCRSRKEKNGRSYNAYLVEKVGPDGKLHSFVFGGDTGYTSTFRALGDRMRTEGREIDIALMPIGAYNPWVNAHCNPEQAWKMTQEMNAQRILPIHWNTYVQSSEPRYEPIEWLEGIVEDPSAIVLSEHGETWTLPHEVTSPQPRTLTEIAREDR